MFIMKKNYVRPTMESEVFVTNAYCGACTDQPALPNTLIVDLANGNWNSMNNSGSWDGDRTKYVTRHEFSQAVRVEQESNGIQGAMQYYYPCTCTNHDGKYYLEYSAYYTQIKNDNVPTFFLYRESNKNNGLQLASGLDRWPASSWGSDEMVAQVQYSIQENLVINS